MKNKKLWVVGLVVAIVAVLVLGNTLPIGANGAVYSSVLGTYTLKGNAALYGEDGKRLRDGGGVIVKCKTGTLVIDSQVVDVISGTLTLTNIETVFEVEGWIGQEGKTATLTVWGDCAVESPTTVIMVLRGRIKANRQGVVTGLGYIKIQGLNDDVLDKYIFEGRMICREFVAPQ